MSLSKQERDWLAGMIPLIDFLKCCDSVQINYIIDTIEKISLKPKKIIVAQGQQSTDFYIIGQGEVGVWITNGSEKRFITHLRMGRYFGEMSLLTGEPCSAEVITNTDTIVYKISSYVFKDMVRKEPQLQVFMADVIKKRKNENNNIFGRNC